MASRGAAAAVTTTTGALWRLARGSNAATRARYQGPFFSSVTAAASARCSAFQSGSCSNGHHKHYYGANSDVYNTCNHSWPTSRRSFTRNTFTFHTRASTSFHRDTVTTATTTNSKATRSSSNSATAEQPESYFARLSEQQPLPTGFVESLQSIVGSKYVVASAAERERHGHDESWHPVSKTCAQHDNNKNSIIIKMHKPYAVVSRKLNLMQRLLLLFFPLL